MKKKELKPVDHSKISYINVRKNLYIIPKALALAPEEKVSGEVGGVPICVLSARG